MLTVQQSTLEQLTETAIDCFENNQPFSAYNITLMTRQRNQLRLRHQDVIGVIHQIEQIQDVLDYGYTCADGRTITWQKSDYTKPWTDQNGNPGPVFQVYHPAGYDLNDFVPVGARPATASEIQASVRPVALIGLVTPQADGTQPDAGGDQGDGTYKTDYRNRLLIPTKFLKEAGLTSGDVVNVLADPQNACVFLSKETHFIRDVSLQLTNQRVERNGDIRLSGTTLKKAELNDNTFVIENTERDGRTVNGPCKVKGVEIKSA